MGRPDSSRAKGVERGVPHQRFEGEGHPRKNETKIKAEVNRPRRGSWEGVTPKVWGFFVLLFWGTLG